MGRYTVPAVVVAAILAFAVAAASMAIVPDRPRLWSASVGLIVLSGITPMIYAVNIRIVPVFSRRAWQNYPLLRAGVLAGLAGGWVVYLARATGRDGLETAGHAAALAGGAIFVASIIMLFRSDPVTNVSPPLPYPEQAEVDRMATRFMRLSSIFLLLGLVIGLVVSYRTPDRGRWDLVWAHTMLVGWFISMASGVSYHVFSRWTGQQWRSLRRIRWHFGLTCVALPAMLLALATDWTLLFAIAGPVQAVAVLAFLWNIVPLVMRLPRISRDGLIVAASFLALGVLLGASAAMDPENHTRLRFSHAQINLLGWTGLLISSMGYYLFPRFAGGALQWPRLARVQLFVHATGVLVGAVAWWWYLAVDMGAAPLIRVGGLLVSTGFVLFAAIIAATFRRAGRVVTSGIQLSTRRSTPPVR